MLGFFEAGFFPGVTYYLSWYAHIFVASSSPSIHQSTCSWYKRSEFGSRVAVFFSAATASGAFGGLLAAAISNLNGKGGKPGWAWIFIIEGLITVVAGAVSIRIIQDFPQDAKFLNEQERAFVIRRLQNDSQFPADGKGFQIRYVWQSLSDWKTWLAMLVFMGSCGPLYSFSLFLPTIIKQLGYKSTEANLLTVPVYVGGCIFTCFIGIVADRYRSRGWCNILCLSIAAASYIILASSRNAALSYFAVYLGAM
jgi:sugar phosphate permease